MEVDSCAWRAETQPWRSYFRFTITVMTEPKDPSTPKQTWFIHQDTISEHQHDGVAFGELRKSNHALPRSYTNQIIVWVFLCEDKLKCHPTSSNTIYPYDTISKHVIQRSRRKSCKLTPKVDVKKIQTLKVNVLPFSTPEVNSALNIWIRNYGVGWSHLNKITR